ncbi:DUF4224 domain-containing protein [Alcaligenes faecalis]|uniref:DUF4224 domain-containing protein n=1 Tax=Alcaligenes faecalis TaxID=511 RepID=UPI002AD2022A|nr:DUF4224 domain-containing protein [Alcaligenes faecalis]
MGGHMGADVFLTPAEVAELTGINKGKRISGHLLHREQLQVQWLRTSGIPFFENARGRPIVARAAIEGRTAGGDPKPVRAWQPSVLTGG